MTKNSPWNVFLKMKLDESACARTLCMTTHSWYVFKGTLTVFVESSPKIIIRFCPVNQWSMIFHQTIPYASIFFNISSQEMTFFCMSNSNALSLKEKCLLFFGQKMAIPIIVKVVMRTLHTIYSKRKKVHLVDRWPKYVRVAKDVKNF